MTQEQGTYGCGEAPSERKDRDARASAGGERVPRTRRPPALSDYGAPLAGGLSDAPSRPLLLLAGVDSLYAAYFVDVRSSDFDWDNLAYLKESLKHDKHKRFAEIPLGSETLALMPHGGHPYTYVLRSNDFIIRLGERISPACHVQFTSQGLWTHGVQYQNKRILNWLTSLGFKLTREESISRIDLALDYHLPSLELVEDQFVSRAEVKATWRKNDQVETFQIGKGDTVLRVYDKVAEIDASSSKRWFFDLWGMRENVWRVELQLRSGRLKQGAIRSLQDWDALGGDILREVLHKHTTLREIGADSNRSRWPLHPVWRAVQEDIEKFEQQGLVRDLNAKAGLDWRKHRLVTSIYGMVKRLGCFEALQSDSKDTPDLEWTLEALKDALGVIHHPITWQSEIERLVAAERLGL